MLKKNYFTWKDNNKDTQIGVSAQEIQEIYPELVSTDENGMLSVAYDKLSVVALAAIDKLHDEVTELKSENESLKDRVKYLEDKLEMILNKLG
jgi:ubiquinone biosynthesis protein UbiJ